MEQNKQTQQLNTTQNLPPKRSFWRSFLVVVLIFVFVSVLVGRALTLTFNNYSLNLEQVQAYVDELNQPVDMQTLVTHAITEDDYANFVAKANASGFEVFDDQNELDTSPETIALESDITLTDAELGAFLNRLIGGEEGEYSDLFELLQVSLVQGDVDYALTTVASINFASVKDQIDVLIDNFPTVIYITTQSRVVVANNQLQLNQTTVQLNQVEEQVNTEIVTFLNALFGTESGDYTFSELVSILVQEQLSAITSKTSSYLVLQEGAVLFTLTEPFLDLQQD